jgi:hypothetical protein
MNSIVCPSSPVCSIVTALALSSDCWQPQFLSSPSQVRGIAADELFERDATVLPAPPALTLTLDGRGAHEGDSGDEDADPEAPGPAGAGAGAGCTGTDSLYSVHGGAAFLCCRLCSWVFEQQLKDIGYNST